MKKTEIEFAFYEFPLLLDISHLPFDLEHQYGYCYVYNYGSLINDASAFNLIGVLNFFNSTSLKNSNCDFLKNANLLFAEKLFLNYPKKGVSKWVRVNTETKFLTIDDLPVFSYTNSLNLKEPERNANWFYVEKGEYEIFKAKQSTYEEVSHLEKNNLNNGYIIRFKTCIELIKREATKLNINFTIERWREIAFHILKSYPVSGQKSDSECYETVDVYLYDFLRSRLQNK